MNSATCLDMEQYQSYISNVLMGKCWSYSWLFSYVSAAENSSRTGTCLDAFVLCCVVLIVCQVQLSSMLCGFSHFSGYR